MKNAEFGALWKKKDKNGNDYLSGTVNIFPFGLVNIRVFKNTFKQKDSQPDYKILYDYEDSGMFSETQETF